MANGYSVEASSSINSIGPANTDFDQTETGTKSSPTAYASQELAKLAARKRDLENKLATTRTEYATLTSEETTLKGQENGASASSNNGSHSKNDITGPATTAITDNTDTNKHTSAACQKRVTSLTRDEIKLVSQIRKLETQEQKAVSKIEAKQRRDAEKDEKIKAKTEIDGLRKEVQRLKNEIGSMKQERRGWLELVGRLQRENTELVAERDRAVGIEGRIAG
jgi:chromosome segregation ATPase